MADLNLKSFDKLYPMVIHKYKDLIPSNDATIMDKLNSIVDYLNKVGKLTNDVVKDWNVVYQWVMNDGLTADVNAKIDTLIANGTLDQMLQNDFVPQLQSQVNDISLNAKQYGVKGDNVTDDTTAIQNFINNAPDGSVLFFPFLTGCKVTADITINKNVTILGLARPYYDGTTLKSGTFLNGGGFYVSNTVNTITVRFHNFGVITSLDNGFELRGLLNDSLIENCISVATDHCYLIEEYEGLIERTKVRGCVAYNAVHGFVSKARRTLFEKCHAFNNTANGFVFVSDNIKSATQLGNCVNNTALNCTANSCATGFNAYSRDMFSSNNANLINHEGLSLINCHSYNATYTGFLIGDVNSAPSGNTYNQVNYARMIDCFERNSGQYSLRIEKAFYFDADISCNKPVNYTKTGCSHVKLKTTADMNEISSYHGVETLTVNSTTPSVASGVPFFTTANTQATTIASFAGGVDGMVIELLINDDFTVINNGSVFSLSRNYYKGKGSTLKLFYDGATSQWIEITGKFIGTYQNQNIVGNGTLDLKNHYSWDLYGSGTSLPISFSNTNPNSKVITLMFRSTSSGTPLTFSFASGIQLPAGFPTQATFSTAVIAQFVYNDQLAKWMSVSWQNVPTGN